MSASMNPVGYKGLTQALNESPVLTDLKGQVEQAAGVADAALPATGGTATDLRVANDPTADQHAVRKSWYDFRKTYFLSRGEVQEAVIPPLVVRITTFFHSAGNINARGGADWKAVASQPSHKGWTQSADGRFWEIANARLSPFQFGAAGDGITDDSQALQDWWDTVVALSGTTAGYATAKARTAFIDTGRFKAWGLRLSASTNGINILGNGNDSVLDGVEIEQNGLTWNHANYTLIDTRPKTGSNTWADGSVGLRGTLVRYSSIRNVRIQNKEQAFLGLGGATNTIVGLQCSAFRIGMFADGLGDTEMTNSSFMGDGSTDICIRWRDSQELKLEQVRAIGARIASLYVEGSPAIGATEIYMKGCTFTGDVVIPQTISRIVDNGSGYARVITGEEIAIASVQDQPGLFLGRGETWRGARAWFDITGTAGQVDQVAVAGTSLLSAVVPFRTNLVTTAADVAAAINAGTAAHGYTALPGQGRAVVEIYADRALGAAANGRAVVVSLSGGLSVLTPLAYTLVTTATPHGLSGGEDVHFYNDGLAAEAIEPLYGAPSATTLLIRAPLASVQALALTKLCLAGRHKRGLTGMGISGSPVASYNGSWNTLATGPGWFDIASANNTPVPFTAEAAGGTLTGLATNIVIDAEELNYRVNDVRIHGNTNRVICRSGYNVGFGENTRLTRQVHLDPRIETGMRTNRFDVSGLARARAGTTFTDNTITGARTGWTRNVQVDPSNSNAPGFGGRVLEAPAKGKPTTDGYAAVNQIGAFETGLKFVVAGQENLWNESQFPVGPHTLGGLAAAVGFLLTSAGINARLIPQGAAADLGLQLASKGSTAIQMRPGDLLGASFEYLAGATDYFRFFPGVSGTGPQLRASAGPLRLQSVDTSTPIVLTSPLRNASRTVATLPTPSVAGGGALVWCSDLSGGAGTVECTGTLWRRVDTRATAA